MRGMPAFWQISLIAIDSPEVVGANYRDDVILVDQLLGEKRWLSPRWRRSP